MDWLMQLLTDADSVGHILLVYSMVIALGMALGRIKVFGISLGVTFVLFAALGVSYAGVTVNGTVLNFLRDFGLILFVFFIGLQVGPSFFSSFKSGGVQLNLLTLLAVGLSLVVTIALFFLLQGTVTLPQMLGVHFGAVTNTPGLGATQEALDMLGYKGENIAIAYACAYPLGVVGIIGIILLIGIVKKNAIMMIDFALEAERQGGKDPQAAIRQACLLRLRPILMTTMAALLGALPLMIGWGMGAELRRPLGVTMVGGLIVSQVLTLFTTPVIYIWFGRLAEKLGRRGGEAGHEQA